MDAEKVCQITTSFVLRLSSGAFLHFDTCRPVRHHFCRVIQRMLLQREVSCKVSFFWSTSHWMLGCSTDVREAGRIHGYNWCNWVVCSLITRVMVYIP